jgi:hypothetical protein
MPVAHMPIMTMEQVSPLMKRKSPPVVDAAAADGWSKRPKSDLTTRTTTFTTHVPDPLSSPSLPVISPRHYGTLVETTTAGMPPPSPHAPPGGTTNAFASASASTSARRDPPGFSEFKTDPEFCLIILRAVDQYKNANRLTVSDQSAVSLFVQGLLNSEFVFFSLSLMCVLTSVDGF